MIFSIYGCMVRKNVTFLKSLNEFDTCVKFTFESNKEICISWCRSKFKGTLIQIWKSVYIFVFIWKQYVEDVTHWNTFFLFEVCAREICEKIVYKHSETIEYVQNYPTFSEIHQPHAKRTGELLGYCFYMNTNI